MGSGIGIWMWVEVVCFFPFPWWYFDKSDTESIRFAKRSCETSRLQPPAPSHLTATLHWWWHCWHNYSQCVAAWCLVWPRAWVAMQHYLLQAAAAATSGTHIATHCHNCHTAQCCLHTATMGSLTQNNLLVLYHDSHIGAAVHRSSFFIACKIFATLDSKSFLYIYLNFTK